MTNASKVAAPARKIITVHVYPPIPFRGADWCAYFDGDEEGPRGFGETEQQAINDLLEDE